MDDRQNAPLDSGALSSLEENTPAPESRPPYQPYSRKARLWAWVGVAFMVFLVIMYTYSLATGKIMAW